MPIYLVFTEILEKVRAEWGMWEGRGNFPDAQISCLLSVVTEL